MTDLPPGKDGPVTTVFVVAGEESGDQLGASLMDAVSERLGGQVVFVGVGGARMAQRGLESLFPMEDISLHGLTQILPRIPALLAAARDTAAAAVAARPQVVVLIDVPGFNMRVGKAVKARAPDIPVVDYVSPTVWAYAPWRARSMARFIDLVMAILPFEPAEHARLGGPPCRYVGHPLIEMTDRLRPGAGERLPLGDAPTLLVLPGSRRSEVKRLLAPFGEALALLARDLPGLRAVLPAAPHVEAAIRAGVASWAVQPEIVTGEEAKHAAFRSAHAALAASGTVSLELALAGVPAVIAYRVDPLVRLLKPFLTAKHIGLANLVLERRVMPELLDGETSPGRLAAAVAPLLRDTPERAAQISAFTELDARMMSGEGTPSGRAADLVIAAARGERF